MNCNPTLGGGQSAMYPPCRCSGWQGNVLDGCNKPQINGGGGGYDFGSATQAAAYVQDLIASFGPLDNNISITLQIGFQTQGVLGQAGMVNLTATVLPMQRMENETGAA